MGSVVLEVCSTTSIRVLSLKLRREKTVRFFCFLWESGLRGNGEASDASVLEPGPQGSPSVEDRRFRARRGLHDCDCAALLKEFGLSV